MPMDDTPPEIKKLVRNQLLARSGAERVQMGSRMFDAARAMVLASFPTNLSEIEKKVRLCERLYRGEINIDGFRLHLIKRAKASELRIALTPKAPDIDYVNATKGTRST